MNAEEFRNRIAALPPVEGNTYWDDKRREFRHSVQHDNLSRFLRWNSIGITMYLGGWHWVEPEYRELQRERPEWAAALKEDEFGGADYYHIDPTTNANVVHMGYHLLQWEKATGRKVTELDSILEIGGGYGCMAKVVHRLGFRGKYYIYDLPEFSLLQEFYLSHVLAAGSHNIEWVNTREQDRGRLPGAVDLWLATWSFSEFPKALRQEIISQTTPQSYLIGYQHTFEWVDNMFWFAEYRRNHPEYDWTSQQLTHQDGQPWYLFGMRKLEEKMAAKPQQPVRAGRAKGGKR
jgi:hypothetical protein